MANYCAVLTNTDRELLKHLPGEDENSLRGLIGIWMENNPDRTTDHPSLEEIKSLISQLRDSKMSPLISPTIENYKGNWTRGEAARDPESLYIFTDNTDRDSGKGLIDPMSKYSQKYGRGKHFPTMTQAVLRGLDNAMPLSTQRWYHEGAKGVTGRWTDADFEEFKKVIDAEIEDIVKEWNTGKYKRIVIGSADGFFNTKISNISMERTPILYKYLQRKLAQIGIITSQPIAEAPINIYAGTGENAHLSNFAVRPFTITNVGEDSDAPIYGTFKTVEGAFQAQKLAYSSMSEQEQEAIRKQLETASGAEARRIGRTIKGLDTEKWDKLSSGLMHNIILASFQQNPQALQQLLATGNAQLTHTQDRSKWGKEFPRILMEVREELKGFNSRSTTPSTVFSVSSSTSYPVRTRENAEWSDITLALAENFSTAGEKLTQRVAGTKYVSHSLSSSNNPQAIADSIYDQIASKGKVKDLKLNIAGNGIYTLNQPQEYYNNLLTEVLSILQSKGVTISAIRSGGQTGIDEAGIIAAQRLGIPSIVHTTSDFKFRGKDNKDVSDEARFKNRFSQQSAEEMLDDALLPPPPVATETTPSDINPFELPVGTVAEQRAADLVFDPRIRRDRVTLISRLFSEEVDAALEEKEEDINRRIMEENLSEKQRNDLKRDLYSLDRISIIRELKPSGIFNRVRGTFEEYVNDSDEGRVQAELNKINATRGAEKYSDEKKLKEAKKRAAYKYQEYQKVIKHFKVLAEEASGLLIMTEGIRVDPNYEAPSDANLNDDDPEGNSEGDSQADDSTKEETVKDGWMTNFRQVSSHESLSQAVRKVIRETPSLDYRGKYKKDDLGNNRYLDADYVHATLINKLRYMITSEDMVPLLEELSKLKPWVKQIVKTINNDDSLFSQFYQDFRKDFVQYWIQKKIMNPDGTFRIETIPINKPEGVYYLLDSWRDNYESGTLLDEDSIYEKNGEINKENAAIGLKIFNELNNKFSNATTQEGLELLENEEIWGKLIKMLNMVGIDPNPSVLRTTLTNIRDVPGIEFTDPIKLFLPQLQTIFRGVQRGEVKSETTEDGTVKRGDLINTFGSAYNKIASMIAEVTEDAIESSVRENDKTYYSHVLPSYLGKLIKQLKNAMNDKERFDKFIQDEFGQYEWFFKDGEWRSDWVKKLATDSSMRDALQHKVILNYDKRAYQDWDDLDYTMVLLNEFWAEPREKMAWYHVPILSDSPSAEFIRFVRYTTGSEIDEDGNDKTYQDIILDKMLNIVNQEYDRIQFVKERHSRYLAGDKNISPIANFDIIGDRKGGSEFKFIPELNNIKYDNGETFLDRFERLKQGSPSEFKKFLKDTLNDIMEEGFESTYAEWVNIGLLDELSNGKFKNLPSNKFAFGQSQTNQRVATALKEAQKVLGNLFTSDMRILLDRYTKNKSINDKQANKIFDQIRDILNDKVTIGELETPNFDSIMRNLTTKNNAKDALREYYWNSKFATSQIIQLTTTDLAFYKDMEDFQKRFKEVHAPSLRLNTMAKFHGETIGRTWERTIYLADDEIVSSIAKDVEELFLKKYKDGEFSAFDTATIISKYGLHNVEKNGKKYYKVGDVMVETSYVNVADAQAYRSLSSYRAMMGMQGQWTDDMETAYKHLTDPNGQWTMEDFNMIWQTKKPYVYTQVNNDSGVPGHTGIKTPVQHKNSEFLLLAIYDAIAGPLGKSGKLKAINDFMEKNQIDVVQFESTTKVGKQGVINLNTVKDYDTTMRVLGNATGIAHGMENPNVVHKVSYEDYGIQTATPEHVIDAVQLVGTQIRKLITADIADDAQITVGNKTMTKAEWFKLYNAINTENILRAFREIDDMFQDPKEVEKALQEEIRGNQRYGNDMLRACTLNDDGEFNIPLYGPVQSQRVQTLLNSIIKSRITKQKIKGGSLIQVSAYGLSDKLKIVWEGEGDNKRIKYFECYMPAYSRDFYEPLMDENGQLDIKKLPEDLRKLIGYRVPTEDKYSMAPLYIKGFLPQQNGSAIMLPAEITTLSGSDFDVDKLYIMLPEFKYKKEYDIKAAWDDFYTDPENADISDEIDRRLEWGLEDYKSQHPDDEDLDIDDYLEFLQEQGVKKYQLSENAQKRFSAWFKTRKSDYFLGSSIEKLNYDYSKPAHQQKPFKGDGGKARRNNALIDMMWGILTNPDTASKMLNPGGFDKQKSAARIVTILDFMSEKELAKEGYTISDLLDLPLDTLNKLAAKAKKRLDPLSPRTQVILHQQNMTGGKMIGIYANHNANHALMQHTQLAVDDENGSFTLAGVRRTSLHGVKNESGDFISRNTANFLAASVDNVKDNTLHATNQNTFTGDASMLLSRLGYNPTEIAILMRQPIVMEITRKFFRESRDGKSKDAVIEEVLAEAKQYAGMYKDLSWANIKDNTFELEMLMKDIQLHKEVGTMSQDDRKNFYRRQVTVGILFKRIMNTADALGQLVQATRADTQGGAAGPTIADTMIKLQKVDDFLLRVYTEEKFPLANANVIMDGLLYTDELDPSPERKDQLIDRMREQLLNSPLPFLQAFYTLGLRQTERILGRYFPHFKGPFKEILDGKYDSEGNLIFEGLRKMTKTGRLGVKTINSIYNDLLAYIMSRTEFFGPGKNKEGKPVSSTEKRRFFINNFPTYFKKVIEKNEDIAELEFIQRLKPALHNGKNPVDVVVFKNVGHLSSPLRDRYMRDWATLLHMRNPKAIELALGLFLYSYYRNGFAFGPSTFIHLAPTAVRDAIDGYISTLRSLLKTEDDYRQFIEQYIYNHLDNRRLVPEIPDTSTTKFNDEEGNIKDEVIITIDSAPTVGDKAAVKKEQRDSEGRPIYEFFEFIGRRVKGKWYYYRQIPNIGDTLPGDNTAIYTRIEPLGYKNSFLEYEWGKEASEIESVIAKNKKDYDPLAEYASQYMGEELTGDMLDIMPDYSEAYSEEAMTSIVAPTVYKQVYGEAPTSSTDSNSITDIEPNEDYRDANDEEICGDIPDVATL